MELYTEFDNPNRTLVATLQIAMKRPFKLLGTQPVRNNGSYISSHELTYADRASSRLLHGIPVRPYVPHVSDVSNALD